MLSQPDLVVASRAMLASAGFAIVPADWALRLPGRTARLVELGYRAHQADYLIHCLGLPEERPAGAIDRRGACDHAASVSRGSPSDSTHWI
jgi:hypothetical protein